MRVCHYFVSLFSTRYLSSYEYTILIHIHPPLGRQALIRRAASALKYIVYNNYAVPNGIRTFFLLVDREKYQTNIDRQMLHKWYLFKYTQKEDHGGASPLYILSTPPVLSR